MLELRARRLFGLLGLGAGAAAIAVGFYTYRAELGRMRQTRLDSLAIIGRMRVAQIAQWRRDRLFDAAHLGRQAFLARELAQASAPDGTSARAELKRWLDSLTRESEYAAATLASPSGVSIVESGTETLGDFLTTEEVSHALESPEPTLSDLHRDRAGGAIHEEIYVPLALEGGAPVGILSMGIDPTQNLFRTLAEWPVPTSSGETVLLRRDGEDALYLSESRNHPGSALSLRVPLAKTENPAVQAVLGNRGFFEGRGLEGVASLAWTEAVPGSPWFVVVEIDLDEAMATPRRHAAALGGLVTSLFLVGVLGVAWAWRRRERMLAERQAVAENRRRDLEAQIGQLYKLSHDILLVADADLRIVEANDRAAGAYGYTPEELRRLNVNELQTPEQASDMVRNTRDIFARGGAVFESTHRRKDGSCFPVEVSVRAIDLGGRHFFQAVVRDVSQRKATEQSLRLLGMAIDQAAESIVIMDAQRRVEYVNPAFESVSGYAAAEVVGRDPRLLAADPGEDAVRHGEVWDVLESGKVWRGRWTNQTKGGRRYEEDAVVSPLFDANGRISHFVAVKRDVTREREIEGQLRQAQKMEAVGRLAGGIAHDFNNLLTVINGFCELVTLRLPPETPVRPQLEEIARAGDRAATLTRQLLAFSRKQVLQPRILDLNVLLREIERMLRRVIGEDVALVSELTPGIALVKADPGQIEQVVLNLAVNARDAMPRGGRLVLATSNVEIEEGERKGAYVRLSVRDTGTGMSDEVKSHLFEPFFTTKEQGKGAGLGLATVYGIVSQSGGFLSVDSASGEGSTFHVHVPRTAEVAESVSQAESDAPVGTEAILVVEDDATVRTFVSTTLRDAGYDVAEARNALEASELFRTRLFELVLTDVIMPDGGGVALSELLLSQRPGLKVLLMSGYTDDQLAVHGVLETGVRLLEKPFSTQLLKRTVRAVLSAKPRRSSYARESASAA
jgi:PAS domain S-box-containing protein